MAKPGDVLEFRSGLHGIEAPQNLGILVERYRVKGTPWVRLVTTGGVEAIKAEHLSKRVFKQRYEGDLKDTEEAAARLRFLIQQHAGGRLAEQAEDDLGALEEALWEATCDEDRVWTEEELAVVMYGPEPSRQQTKDIKAALDRCRRPGTGRFETAGRGDTWRPWTRTERDAMRQAWNRLADLRAKLIMVEETDDGRSFARIDLDGAGLEDADQPTLAWVEAAMAQAIEHDGVPLKDIQGIGGIGAVQAFGMDLHRYLGFLAMDWIRSEHTTRSSDYLHFLLESGRWDAEDAVAALVRRHVNQEPFFEHVPDDDAEAAADALPEPSLTAEEQASGREDLRHLTCHTIDPPDAKDFDDAVGIEDLPDGGTRLWVHIADVSHYVRLGTNLDRHAKQRATSVYLPGRVLPMLPARIADHLCSLRDDGDRFALSVAMDVDATGKITGATFHKAIIRVTENLSYADALDRADAGQEPFVSLLRLADQMREQRRSLSLETGELKVLLTGDGFESLEKMASPATRMIEAFMVAANETVAAHLSQEGVPQLFRCHPLPDPQKAERFKHQAEVMGLDVAFELPESVQKEAAGGSQSLLDQLRSGGGKLELFGGGLQLGGLDAGDDEPPADDEVESDNSESQGFAALSRDDQDAWLAPFHAAIAAIAAMPDRERAEVATLKLLGCMGRAYYTPENEGHFGLASTHYSHFTSPIRRYPDLVVHRNLKAWIGDEPPVHAAEDLERLCDHCSEQERAADSLERRIKSSCLVLASLHGDDAFSAAPARITGITPASCFVSLGGGIEARIPARDLPGGPYQVDEWESMLFVPEQDVGARAGRDGDDPPAGWQAWYDEEYGEQRRVRAKLTDPVQVRLAGRNVADGRTGATLAAWPGQAVG